MRNKNIIFARLIIGCLLLAFATTGCKKETDVFEINKFHLQDEVGNKGGLKSSLEQTSIMYSDLFGAEIGVKELQDLTELYASFGDKNVINERVIQNFLERKNLIIATQSEMRSNLPFFITETYKRFYGRLPNEMEKRYFVTFLTNNPDIEPKEVFYSFLTSKEYQYY